MTCPICKSESSPKFRPFCSKRCADLDLGLWITGAYAIPSEEPPEDVPDLDAPEPDPRSHRH